MADRIKGITIEIGSDTVGLQKALSGVNKQSTALQKELRDVERLLKFNPGNTEALAQKQKLLSDQVSVTTDKLNQLKQAEQQVQAQFASGKISEEQYRAFRREIEFTEGTLQKLKNQMAGMQAEQERMASSTRQLNTLFDATGKSVDDFADSLGSRLTNAIKNGTASSKQLDEAISKIGQEALGAGVDIDKMKQALSKIDDGASLKSVKKDLNALSTEAGEAKKAIGDMGSEIQNVAGALVAGGGLAGAIDQALDVSRLNTKIEISMEVPEASKAAVKEAIRGVEAYGVDAEAALEGVRRQWALNKDASDESNAAVVEGASSIAAAYAGIDFTELIQETNEISKALNISNEEALALTNSLLKAGFPPEQIDIIAEYGTQLKMAGYDAQEIQAIMAAGVDTGTWNIDNLLDGLKEGRIRVAEFGQEVPKALKELISGTDISAKQLKEWGKAVAAGGEGGSKAMTEIATALQDVDDETKRNLIGVQIFGTMYEDQGKNIIDTLLNAQNATVDLKTSQDQLNAATAQLKADPVVQLKQAAADLKVALEPLLVIIANVVSGLASWASENPKLAATIIAIGTAIGILIGACIALAPTFIAISTALGGAGGAAALFGGALAALTGPIGLTVAALAGLGIGAVAVANELKKPSLEVEIFGNKVSESTQKAVGGFLNLNEQATAALNQLSWSGQTVTGEMATNIIATFNQMGTQILTEMQTNHAAQLAATQTFFATSKTLTEQEEAQIVAKVQESQQQQQTAISEGQARIKEILTLAKEEKRAITDAERLEINKIQEEMKVTAVKVMSESEAEQKAILESLKSESSKITAEQAAEVVKNATDQKDKVVKEANSQYKDSVAEIIRMRDESKVISKDQADKLIQEAKRQRDETVKNAQETHQNVVKEAQAQADEHVNKVDWETGQIKSKWQVMKDDVSRKTQELGTNISNGWNDALTATRNKAEEIRITAISKTTATVTAVGNKMAEVKDKVSSGWDKAQAYLSGIDLAGIGADIIKGLANGMGSMASSVWNKAQEIADGITRRIKTALDINSPSRVMKGIGENVGEGLVLGIEGTTDKLNSVMSNVYGSIAGSAEKMMSQGVQSSNYSYDQSKTYQPSITIINQASDASPSEIARKALQTQRQLAMEWGMR
ncbi:hypothetical protein BTO30_12480 [Domibacillus antri]|uniref:Phage tail tape measure protein domain-containing protein n=1 Tax=Domibacillus antri TaxID=1714264 RepID=A0A1Q8Q3K4_9BACI|nr:phage tail tape measure protein [Domibacillus antri]OLN21908.1 hypothetical protein BTO30_12480 [Domibacillus antri]